MSKTLTAASAFSSLQVTTLIYPHCLQEFAHQTWKHVFYSKAGSASNKNTIFKYFVTKKYTLKPLLSLTDTSMTGQTIQKTKWN